MCACFRPEEPLDDKVDNKAALHLYYTASRLALWQESLRKLTAVPAEPRGTPLQILQQLTSHIKKKGENEHEMEKECAF